MSRGIKSFTKKLKVFESTDYHCFYCGCNIEESNWTVDHVIPHILGGTNSLENLVPCCKSCNSTKKDRDIDTFRYMYSCKVQGIPKFSEDQKKWLSSKGFSGHIPKMESFYGETR